jgi:hypothetical protein
VAGSGCSPVQNKAPQAIEARFTFVQMLRQFQASSLLETKTLIIALGKSMIFENSLEVELEGRDDAGAILLNPVFLVVLFESFDVDE